MGTNERDNQSYNKGEELMDNLWCVVFILVCAVIKQNNDIKALREHIEKNS